MEPSRSRGRNPAIVFLILIALPLGLITFTVVRFVGSREAPSDAGPPPPPPPPPDPFKDILATKLPEAQRRYAQVSKKARQDRASDEERKQFEAELEEARAYIRGVQNELEELLAPIREKHGGDIPPEYGGYAAKLAPLQQWLADLGRFSGL